MSTKHTHPAFPPQIALDQFQRPVAPIPGMSMLDYFALMIYCHKGGTYIDAINKAKLFIDALSHIASEEQLSTFKIIDNAAE
jgi:hypothetical protein